MKRIKPLRSGHAVAIPFAACLLWLASASAVEPLGPFTVAHQGVLYMGGTYDNTAAPTTMSGQMHVFYQIPSSDEGNGDSAGRYPIVMIHGSQQTGANFRSEERRVGKACKSGASQAKSRKKAYTKLYDGQK